jgi:hypothetical protein
VCGGVVWIHLAEDRVLGQACLKTIMELMIQSKGGEILKELSDSKLLEKSNVLFILQKMYTIYCLSYISCDTT